MAHRGVLGTYILNASSVYLAQVHDSQIARDFITDQLIPSEKFTGDKGYIGVPGCVHPVKGRDLSAADKELNQLLSRRHVPVEHANRAINVFCMLNDSYRHHSSEGLDLWQLQVLWKLVVFLHNRNVLDEGGQTSAWRIPTRPLLTEVCWAAKPTDLRSWTQRHDDCGGPYGPLRENRAQHEAKRSRESRLHRVRTAVRFCPYARQHNEH